MLKMEPAMVMIIVTTTLMFRPFRINNNIVISELLCDFSLLISSFGKVFMFS